MKKLLQYSFTVLLLSIIIMLFLYYPFFPTSVDVILPNEEIVKTDEELHFEEGYKLVGSGNYQEALVFYQDIISDITDPKLADKARSLMVVLERLNNAEITYKKELEILKLAEEYQQKFLNPSYGLLSELYEFYSLSVEVLIEDNFDKEADLMDLYYDKKDDFKSFKKEVEKLDTPFMNDDVKESFLLTVAYSLYPTEMHYRTTHLEQSISVEEIEKVEAAWEDWSSNYENVVSYYHEFDEGLYELGQHVDALRKGYQDMRSQLQLLVPEIKGNMSL